jgi:hypothetical protein
MSRHLSERQMSEWALGERSPEMERHVGECAECREEVGGEGQALAAFRQSAHQWSERQLGAATPDAWKMERTRPWITFRNVRWACVAAMVLLFAGAAAVWRNHRAAAESAADAVLLRQIDSDVSQAVPDSMEPLVKLVSWKSSMAADKRR